MPQPGFGSVAANPQAADRHNQFGDIHPGNSRSADAVFAKTVKPFNLIDLLPGLLRQGDGSADQLRSGFSQLRHCRFQRGQQQVIGAAGLHQLQHRFQAALVNASQPTMQQRGLRHGRQYLMTALHDQIGPDAKRRRRQIIGKVQMRPMRFIHQHHHATLVRLFCDRGNFSDYTVIGRIDQQYCFGVGMQPHRLSIA